jgi:hypothetical protein
MTEVCRLPVFHLTDLDVAILASMALPKKSPKEPSFCAALILVQKRDPKLSSSNEPVVARSPDRDTGTTEGLLCAWVRQLTLWQFSLHKTRPGFNTETRRHGK